MLMDAHKVGKLLRRHPYWTAGTVVMVVLLAVGIVWLSLPNVEELADKNPTTTSMMEQRVTQAREQGRRLKPRQVWVGLENISPKLVSAVVLSEDASFYVHDGFDWHEFEAALKKNLETKSFARGASTLTQQLAKNLFLGTEKTLGRKLKEALLSVKLEQSLSKRRILSLYLNVAEWGDGVFGIEAGSRLRFGVSASRLTTAQSAVMAAMLPAPLRVNLAKPSAWLKRNAWRVLNLLHQSGRISRAEYDSASVELGQILGEVAPLKPDEVYEEEAPTAEELEPPPSVQVPESDPDPQPPEEEVPVEPSPEPELPESSPEPP